MVANTKQWSKGIDRAKKDLDGFKSHVASSAKEIGAAFATIYSANRIATDIASAARALDDLDTSALKLGIATKELNAFRVAADLADVGVSGLEKSLVRMQKSIVDANSGSKVAADALAALNLNASDLIAMSVDKQFATIAGAIHNVNNQAQQTALAMDLFGKSGADLLPIFKSGSDKFSEFLAQGQKVSTSITQSTIQSAGELDNALKIHSATIDNFLRSDVMADFYEAMKMPVEWLTALVDVSTATFNGEARAFELKPVNTEDFTGTQKWLKSLIGESNRVATEIMRIDESLRNNPFSDAARKQITDELTALERQFSALGMQIDIASMRMDEFNRAKADAIQSKSTEEFLDSWRATLGTGGGTPFRDAIDSFKGFAKQGKDAFDSLIRQGDVAAYRIGEAFRTQHREYMAGLKEEADAIRESIKSIDELFGDEMDRAAELVAAGQLSSTDAKKYLMQRADAFGLNGEKFSVPGGISNADIAGSAGAVNSIVEAIARSRGGSDDTEDIQKRIESRLEKLERQAEKQTKAAERTATAVENIGATQ